MGKILIVDDEVSIRTSLSIFLVREGHHVDVAANAFDAHQMITAADYDVVLTDVIMPQMTGIELLGLIREKSSVIQVIIMTGEPTVETAVVAVQQGANNYLCKPINKSTLINMVRQALEIKQLHDEKSSLEIQQALYLKDLEETVRIQTQSLQESMQSIVLLLSTVIESKDPYTAGHQRRVGNLSAEIARKMGMETRLINNVRITGYLHDIGKISVPSEILTKPGKLNEYEIGLIKLHCSSGYTMLDQVKLPDRVAEIVYQHHERIDGSGYPQGLKESEMLNEACIIGVADVVEAIMSHRPYRAALGIEAALHEIKQNRGRLYQKDVVDACIELFEKDGYILNDQAARYEFTVSPESLAIQAS